MSRKRNNHLESLVCPSCGSDEIQIKAWVNANTLKYQDTTEEEAWCPICEEHTKTVTLDEYLKDKKD